jgi:hypothetical protein
MNDFSLYAGTWERRFSPRPAAGGRPAASMGEVALLAERLVVDAFAPSVQRVLIDTSPP